MERMLGKIVAVAALRSSSELNNLVPLLKERCDDAEYEEMRDALADVSLAISRELLQRIFRRFPDLESELDAHYQQYGRPA